MTMEGDPNISGPAPAAGGYTEGARVYHDAAQDIVNITVTSLDFNSERFDTDGIHSVLADIERLTCKTAGVYVIAFSCHWEADNDGIRAVGIVLNGDKNIGYDQRVAAGGGAALDQTVSTVYKLEVNDYVTLDVYHTAGNNLEVQSFANWSPEFMMQRIG